METIERLAKQWIEENSTIAGYADIRKLRQYLKKEMRLKTYDLIDWVLVVYFLDNESYSFQEASSGKEVGLIVYERQAFSGKHKRTNYLFIRKNL